MFLKIVTSHGNDTQNWRKTYFENKWINNFPQWWFPKSFKEAEFVTSKSEFGVEAMTILSSYSELVNSGGSKGISSLTFDKTLDEHWSILAKLS